MNVKVGETVKGDGGVRWTRPIMVTPRDRNAELGLPSPRVLGRHAGEWVAIVNRKIIASGRDYLQVVAEAERTAKGKEPSLLHVTSNEILLL